MRQSVIILFFLFIAGPLFSQKSALKPWTNSSKDDEWIRNTDFESRGTAIGKVTSLPEASGIGPSFANPGYIWGHNDSGQKPWIWLIDSKDASIYSILHMKPNMNIDWEDIECVQEVDKKRSYIYLADIGDNLKKRNFVTIYIVLDEKMPFQKFLEANIQQTVNFTYPKGALDAEAIMVDPITKDIFIVSKREKFVKLYSIKFPYKTDGIDTAIQVGTFPFNQITGGSISPDGNEILIRSYGRVFYWKRKEGESISEALNRDPQLAPYYPIEPQGEAICWDISGGGYYTLSEKRRRQMPDPTLYYYKRSDK